MKCKWLYCGLLLLFSCNFKLNNDFNFHKDNINNAFMDKCEIFYLNDEQSNLIFKDYLLNTYQIVAKANIEKRIILQPIINAFDSAKTDTVFIVNTQKDFFKFYSSNGIKTLLELNSSSNIFKFFNGVEIDMDSTILINEILKPYVDNKIMKGINCIHFTTLSEYDHLYFVIKNGKLAQIKYISNVDSFR